MVSPVEQGLRELIRREGRISFARFMEVALYSPEGGYYTSSRPEKAEGDYFTSPAAHPVFGALLAVQLEQLWQELEQPQRFFAVEAGAGSGLLAQEVTEYARHLSPGFCQALAYVALDRRSPPLRLPGLQQVIDAHVPLRRVTGCFLSNELVDSLPVHRFTVQRGRLLEVYVTLEDDRFAEVLEEPSTPRLMERLESEGVWPLPEGHRGEVNLALEDWMAEVAAALDRGFVFTIDYGYPASQLYAPERAHSTLRCYYRHTLGANPYQWIGRQDMTAHVDFTALAQAGLRHGLQPLGLLPQRQLLMNLGWEAFLQGLQGLGHTDIEANRVGMRELVKPGGLGDFSVLIQAKGVEDPQVHGLQADNPTRARLLERARARSLHLPVLTDRHVPLYRSRYPEATFEIDWRTLWPGPEEEDQGRSG